MGALTGLWEYLLQIPAEVASGLWAWVLGFSLLTVIIFAFRKPPAVPVVAQLMPGVITLFAWFVTWLSSETSGSLSNGLAYLYGILMVLSFFWALINLSRAIIGK